jgi:phenylacetate-CoA ligase
MHQLVEQGYYLSPVWLQNLAVTAFGYSLHRQRSGRDSAFLDTLRAVERWPEAQVAEYVDTQLRGMIAHAFTHVPYYRGLARNRRLQASDIRSVRDLWKLPILEKEQIRRAPQNFLCESSAATGARLTLSTSGTTGKPLTIYCDAASRQRHYAFWSRLRAWFGITPSMHRATFFGRIICSPSQQRPPFWRYDRFQRNYLFSSYHLAPQYLDSYCDALRRLQPPEIIGYPSSLAAVAAHVLDRGLTDIRPRVIFTTAETLLESQRRLIEQAFSAPVVDQYGCTEMAMFVSQCEEGAYHVHPEHGILEVVDSSGAPVAPGGVGQAVCTGLVNRTMPLLRYKLGDRVALREGACACGRSFPMLASILGRTDDVLVTPSGRPLGRLDPVFKPLSGLRATQIVQPSVDRLVVKAVVDRTFSRKDAETLLYELRKRTGDEMNVALEFVDTIPKDANGKFRAVVSLIERSPR